MVFRQIFVVQMDCVRFHPSPASLRRRIPPMTDSWRRKRDFGVPKSEKSSDGFLCEFATREMRRCLPDFETHNECGSGRIRMGMGGEWWNYQLSSSSLIGVEGTYRGRQQVRTRPCSDYSVSTEQTLALHVVVLQPIPMSFA